jgi:tetratricopeptide (TPR) repeat protein
MDSDARFTKCLEIFKLVKNDRGIADVYTNRADIEIERGNTETGREYIDVALGIFAKPTHKVDLWKHSTALNISANVYFIEKNFQKAIDELKRAVKLLGGGPFEQKDKSDLYNNLGITHMAYAASLRGSILEKFMDYHLKESEDYFRLHLQAVSEMEERSSDWFQDNGFFEDSEHWTQFPPSTSPKWL